MIEKLVEVGYLFDFYGKLLSERQYNVVELFYLKDYSLSEIGEILGITRQAVYDNLKRAEQNLYSYEEALKLWSKFKTGKENVKEIIEISEDLKDHTDDEVLLSKINKIEKIANSILENSWR